MDVRALEFCKSNDVVGLLRYLDSMWIVKSLQILEDLIQNGIFYPNPSRYNAELLRSGVFVQRMQVMMAASLAKTAQINTDEEFKKIYSKELEMLPAQQQREIEDFWRAGPKPGLITGTSSISSAISGLSIDKYVDLFVSCKYDINYKVTNFFSSTLQLTYLDGTQLELDLEADFMLPEKILSSAAARDEMALGRVGLAGRIFPRTMAANTVPRLWAARLEALDVQAEAFRDFANLAVTGVAVVLTIPAMPTGAAPSAPGIGISRAGIVRRQVPGIKQAVAAGVSEAELSIVSAIRANPEFANLTNQEILAIRSYSGENWGEINMALRNGGGSPQTQLIAKSLISGLKKMPGYRGKLVRSESLAVSDATKQYVKGKIYTPSGMMSTSRGGAVAQREGNIAITIHATGGSGKDISKAAVHGGSDISAKELEVLFPPGTRFIVEDVQTFGQALMVTLREL